MLMMNKNTINLLQLELMPNVALFTLKRVVMVWMFFASVMLISVLFVQYKINLNDIKNNQLTKVQLQRKQQISDLENKLKSNKTSASLMTRLSILKYSMKNKQSLHGQLTKDNTTYVAGFSKAMTDLSNMHSTSVSLKRVIIDHDEMTLIGMAKSPEAIPAWLALFSKSSVLSGKVFNHFTLNEGESSFANFVVSTSHKTSNTEFEVQEAKL